MSELDTNEARNNEPDKRGQYDKLHQQKQDTSLFMIVALLLVCLMFVLIGNLYIQHQNYETAIAASLKSGGVPDHSAILTYARALDFTIVKISTVFIGFILVLVGALYVLRSAQVSFSLGVNTSDSKLSLQTASPGLVMVTLGVITVIAALYAKSYITYEPIGLQQPNISVNIVPPKFNNSSSSLHKNNESLKIQSSKRNSSPKESKMLSYKSKGQSIDDFVTFQPGEIKLDENNLKKIDKFCEYIREKGLTDLTLEARGDTGETDEFNLALAERRRTYLSRLLSERCSYKPKFSVNSYGKEKPADNPK